MRETRASDEPRRKTSGARQAQARHRLSLASSDASRDDRVLAVDAVSSNVGMVRVPFEELRARIERVLLKLGLGQRSALAAQLIAETDRDGVRTHGIARVPRFAEMVRAGRIDPRAEPERVAASVRWSGGPDIAVPAISPRMQR